MFNVGRDAGGRTGREGNCLWECAGQKELSLDFPPFPRWKLLGWGCGFLLCPCRQWDHLSPEEQKGEKKNPLGTKLTSGREDGAQGGGFGEEPVAGPKTCRTKSSEHFPYALGEGDSGDSYRHLGWGRTRKNNMKNNQHHRLSLKRENMDLMITGHLLLILREGGNLNPYLKLW